MWSCRISGSWVFLAVELVVLNDQQIFALLTHVMRFDFVLIAVGIFVSS